MIKKTFLFIFVLSIFSVSVFSTELGFIAGSIDNPRETIYGLSASGGFIVPILKFEFEYYNMNERKYEALTAGVKLRKRFKKFAPYAILGVGSEFEHLTFKFENYKNFVFVGGGLHFYFGGFFSIRADLRFLNYSDNNKIRLSAGIFFHI